MDSIKLLTVILTIVLGIMVMLLMVLGIVYASSRVRANKDESLDKKQPQNNVNGKSKRFKEYKTDSIMNFMEFDTVVDNMISQKNGMRYIMVVECQGINYDLMSQAEKNSVEEGFLQFLNTLRYPVQIYTQTRTINLDSSLQTYREKIKEIEYAYEKQKIQYEEMQRNGRYTEEQLNRAYFELTKQRNLYEYGKDIIYNTEKMSLNKNVLNKKYYVVVPYFVEELGEGEFDKEEQRGMAFSELYTRAQSVIRTLGVCGINGKVMNSDELVELLYMAYNRDEAEVYGLDKALKAGYDELYSTAPDVIDKQMKEIDKEIEEKAVEVAKEKIREVKTEKQKKLEEKKNNEKDLIDELAEMILNENAQIVGEDIAKEAVQKLKEDKEKSKAKKVKEKEKGGTKEDGNDEKPKRIRKTKTA